MTTYSPEQTAAWTLDDWNKLAGKAIRLELDGDVWEHNRTVDSVEFGHSTVTITWAECGSLNIVRDVRAVVVAVL